MKIIEQSAEILACPSEQEAVSLLEIAGRTCYQSEPHGDPAAFVRQIVRRGHLSVLEHCSATVRLVTNRGVTHELVRHRIAAYSQESTRYCNYSKGKFGGELTFIRPTWSLELDKFKASCCLVEKTYFELLELGWTPQEAREVLPNSLKTTIVMTADFREWLHVFELRTAAAAHPQIRALMLQTQRLLAERVPTVFTA